MKNNKEHSPFQQNITKLFDAAKDYFPSAYGGWKHRHLWQDIQTYCLFVGYPRSGHSLIGALLNAHPNIIIAHELGDLKYAYLGFGRSQLYYLLMKKAELAAQKDRKLGGYNYYVPNQWQGKVTQLQVIGDKQGEGTTLRIKADCGYLKRLREIIDVQIKFIHVVRNPYDNITTISKKTPKLGYDLERSIEHYFSLCETIFEFKKTLSSEEILEFKQEDFIDNPKKHLEQLCDFLKVSAPQDYLEDCSQVVYKSPNKSRNSISWSPELIQRVQSQIEHYPFLTGYTYEN